MKTTFQFRAFITTGGEILTQPATFLPVQPGRLATGDEIHLPKVLDLAGFLPVLNFARKKLTVAQPLLKGGLR